MQCQQCKEHAATIHLTEITNGKRVETHLCQECAQAQGLSVQAQIPLHELLSTLLSGQSNEESSGPGRGEPKACPRCGMTLRRFSKESLLGCPHDYDVFEKNLLPLIQRSHNGKTDHCGKIPASSAGTDQEKQIRLAGLQKQLEKAVGKEDYETAARLRDEIQRMQ